MSSWPALVPTSLLLNNSLFNMRSPHGNNLLYSFLVPSPLLCPVGLSTPWSGVRLPFLGLVFLPRSSLRLAIHLSDGYSVIRHLAAIPVLLMCHLCVSHSCILGWALLDIVLPIAVNDKSPRLSWLLRVFNANPAHSLNQAVLAGRSLPISAVIHPSFSEPLPMH